MTRSNDMTKGSVNRVFLGFFFPMLCSNLLQQFYTFVDTAIVGKGLGDNALAAVGNTSVLFFLIIGFAQGITNGFGVIFGQHFGSKDLHSLRKSVAASIRLSAVLSGVLTVFSLLFLKQILLLIRTDEAILQESLVYGSIVFGGMTATIAYNLCSSLLMALGDSKTPFVAIIVSSVLNILLDCLFIFGLQTGVGGAALATVLAQLISILICLNRLRKNDFLALTREDFRNVRSVSLRLLKNGIPTAFMNSVTAVGCMIVQSCINVLGVAYTSAYSAGSKYINLFMLPAVTAGFALSAFTSQNYGAKEYARIKAGVKIGLFIAVVSYLILGSVMVFLPDQLVKVLLNGSQPMELAAKYLRICGLMSILLNLLFIFRGAVQGTGKPFIPMCSGFAETLLRIVVIVYLVPEIGFPATAYAEAAAWAGALVMNWIAYLIQRF